MSDAWFHVPQLTSESQHLKLPEGEARHALRVRRVAIGDRVIAFNGRGDWAETELESKSGELRLLQIHRAPRPEPRIHLAAALPKGERFGVLLSMIAQLGIASFSPLDCERSIVRPGDRHRDRGSRILVEACKQSRNPWVPGWENASAPGALDLRGRALFAHPGGSLLSVVLVEKSGAPAELTVLVGPEGGFTEAETTQLTARGATPVSLGPNILRVETAAVALVAGLRL